MIKQLLYMTIWFYSSYSIACGDVVFYSCENSSTIIDPAMSIDSVNYYAGNSSCEAPNNARYEFYQNALLPLKGLTLTVTFYSTDRGNHQARAITNQGTQNMQRLSVQSVIGADGEEWYLHTHEHTFATSSAAVLDYMDIRVKKNKRIDDLNINIETGIGEANNFEYTQNENRLLSFSINDLLNNNPRYLTENIELKITGNTKVIVSHVPPNINEPYDYNISCEDITGFSFTVDPAEANDGGPDIFSVNCISGSNNGDYFFYEIVNETGKPYCLPIIFEIDVEYKFNFLDTIRSIDYTDIFDVRTRFE